jgi:hypothetical protein
MDPTFVKSARLHNFAVSYPKLRPPQLLVVTIAKYTAAGRILQVIPELSVQVA